jgi:hypothetical protein
MLLLDTTPYHRSEISIPDGKVGFLDFVFGRRLAIEKLVVGKIVVPGGHEGERAGQRYECGGNTHIRASFSMNTTLFPAMLESLEG